MRRRINGRTELKGRWLLTFNDMMTLLFAFFVLMISMSHLEATKVKGVSAAVRKVLSMEERSKAAKMSIIEPFSLPLSDEDIEKAKNIEGSKRGGILVRGTALALPLRNLEGVQVLSLKGGFSLSLEEPLLFLPGSTKILKKGGQLLKELATILQRTDVYIRVEGNTDDLPVARSEYPSNWELSAVRAVNIVKYLSAEGGIAPGRLSAVGYGDTRPKVPNLNLQNRRLNRRVDIILTFPDN